MFPSWLHKDMACGTTGAKTGSGWEVDLKRHPAGGQVAMQRNNHV
jgi:hypothetical protein